jgi:DNA-binding NtrC family response regulator
MTVQAYPDLETTALTSVYTAPTDRFQSTGDGEAILVVDDEASICLIISTTLEYYGYRPLIASSFDQAIEIYRNYPGRIGAVLLDYLMPGSDPREAIEAWQQLAPSLPIIMMSGLSTDEIERENHDRVSYFLQKPFETRDLLQVIRCAIFSSASPGWLSGN